MVKILKNKVFVVTGGSGLIGQQILKKLKSSGATVVNIDNNIIEDSVVNFSCDISDKRSVQETILQIYDKYGKIDGWVNNAYPRTDDWHLDFEDIPYDSWKKNIDEHLNGYFICCQQILRKMKNDKNGSLVNMSSIYGVVGPNFNLYEDIDNMTMPAAYSAIKGGIISLTKYLASYYGKYNIRVNSISPGGVYNQQDENFTRKYNSQVPLRRMATPEEIANSVLYLLSPLSTYVNGHNLVVDGGWTSI